jgi:XTP/dITP diphosphohydrolase
MTRKLLIATTNESKYLEIKDALADLPFDFFSLSEIEKKIIPPEETGLTIEDNALLKARYYSEQSGLVTISDDSGIYIDSLGGWPGVRSARIESDATKRNELVIEKLNKGNYTDRSATFRAAIAVSDPDTKHAFMAVGETKGEIIEKMPNVPGNGFGYDPIFYVENLKKTYSELSIPEKNSVSHRGKALGQMKYYLQKQYGGEHVVVPIAIIIKNGKILMAKRNDPLRPDFHNKWEFPGGRMDIGETIEENLIREANEEIGYKLEIIEKINHIATEYQSGRSWQYQVYLLPHVCRITGGEGKLRDAEVLEIKWFDLDDVLKVELIGNNAVMYENILSELKQIIKKNSL